jgi:hypothetical protein
VTKLVVVDTNVPLVANGAEEEVSPNCVVACVDALMEILTDKRSIAIDDDWRILREYIRKLSPSDQPGVGDRFLKWVLTNQANPARCVHVSITPRSDDKEDFEEFPNEPGFKSFDRSDRKFVAVARAHPERPPILEALDSKWWGWREPLKQVGVAVMFLCEDEIQVLYERKFGQRRRRRREPTRG